MVNPTEATQLSAETIYQLCSAAKAMRSLAEGLDQYSNDPDPKNLGQMSCDLNSVGWNALFTSVLIKDLTCALQCKWGDLALYDSEALFEQADILLTAVQYLSKSIETFKETVKQITAFDRERVLKTSRELEQHLKEVLRECQSL
jgi:hypothetical protein